MARQASVSHSKIFAFLELRAHTMLLSKTISFFTFIQVNRSPQEVYETVLTLGVLMGMLTPPPVFFATFAD